MLKKLTRVLNVVISAKKKNDKICFINLIITLAANLQG